MKKALIVLAVVGACLGLALTRSLAHSADPGALTGWERAAQPVLIADQRWEHGVVQEPSVLYRHGRYRVWFEGGWMHGAIGEATSRDGVHWAQHVGPVLGLGASGFAGNPHQNDVWFYRGRYWMAFSDWAAHGVLRLANSPDGIHWRVYRRPILRPDAGETMLANTAIVRSGGEWKMLYERRAQRPLRWSMGLAVSRDLVHWHRVTTRLTGLQLSSTGSYGGPTLAHEGNAFTLLYHAVQTGDLPSDIYQARSRDLVHWHDRTRILWRSLPWEVDQVADPSFVRGRRQRIYYSAMDNVRARGVIEVATANR